MEIGGTGVMLTAVVAVTALCLLLARLLKGRLGWVSALSIAGLIGSVLVIAIVTLIPDRWGVGVVPAETRSETCSMDYGAYPTDGFWILPGSQRLLNTLLFVPAGAFLVLAVARWRSAWTLVPLGLVALAAYSVGIETAQLALARLDRACDVTDMVDNVAGAFLGGVLGLLLALVLRPWRHREHRPGRPG